MRLLIFLFLFVTITTLRAQLSSDIVQERSVVLIDLPYKHNESGYKVRDDWKKMSREVHAILRLLHIDAVGYIYKDDTLNRILSNFLNERHIHNLLILSKNNRNIFRLDCKQIKNKNAIWSTTGGSINQVMLKLAKEIKKLAFEAQNFLILESPYFIPIHAQSSLLAIEKYPTHIMRLTLGVEKNHNPTVNDSLENIMKNYPFAYQFIDYSNDQDAYRRGYEFVLSHVETSGKSIKTILNYKENEPVDYYPSQILNGKKVTIKKNIPTEARVCKFYFRRTSNQQIYVGNYWDADETCSLSLQNFIQNIISSFNRY